MSELRAAAQAALETTAVARDRAGARRAARMRITQAACLALAALVAVLFGLAVPAELAHLQEMCLSAACTQTLTALTPARMIELRGLQVSPGAYALSVIVVEAAFAAVYLAVALVLLWRRPRDPMALLSAAFLAVFGCATYPPAINALEATHPRWSPAIMVLKLLGDVLLILFLYLFPDGRLAPRRLLLPVGLAVIATLPVALLPEAVVAAHPAVGLLVNLVLVAALAPLPFVQLYRYRRVSDRVQRQQTKWVVAGVVAALGGFIALTIVGVVASGGGAALAVGAAWAVNLAYYVLLLLIPLSIGVAVLRYRLWDIDLLLNRALVYGALTSAVVTIYVLVVGYLSTLFHTAANNPAVALVATGVVAVLFQPLRGWLQRGANRLLYGQRDEPYAVLARLGERLGATLAPEAVLPAVVETVAQALKLPYAAISVSRQGSSTIAASYGAPGGAELAVPLTYQGEAVGELALAPRAKGDEFTAADRRLLEDLARQVGVAVHAVRLTDDLRALTADLQRSRERLVTAREDERRRLRRDLHDGLAPTLAALALQAGVLGDLITTEPEAAATLAGELEREIRASVKDIRRLVYELRPPALDELGLAGALRERTRLYPAPHDGAPADRLAIVVEAPEPMPPLPAAVEVAAYRIAQEALTNVARHAQARTCTVRLTPQAEWLTVEVLDDGQGPPAERRAGVGLISMRERAAELGGTCAIIRRPEGGTSVRACLPIGSGQSAAEEE